NFSKVTIVLQLIPRSKFFFSGKGEKNHFTSGKFQIVGIFQFLLPARYQIVLRRYVFSSIETYTSLIDRCHLQYCEVIRHLVVFYGTEGSFSPPHFSVPAVAVGWVQPRVSPWKIVPEKIRGQGSKPICHRSNRRNHLHSRCSNRHSPEPCHHGALRC